MIEEDRCTAEAFADPQPGDRFCEMFSFWLYVVARDKAMVTTIEAGVPGEFPKDGTIRVQTVKDFAARFAHRPDDPTTGYWMTLRGRSHDVSWFVKQTVAPDPREAVDPCELEGVL